MPIKYGELTIIHNTEEQTNIFTYISSWLGCEQFASNKSKFVFLFEDGEICDTDNNLKDFKFKFYNGFLKTVPRWFEKTTENKETYNRIYFYKDPIKNENNKQALDFKQLFSSSTKYNRSMNIPSYYNSIYYCHKLYEKAEIFGILRLKSNESMPRFQFAYEADEFTKEEVIYLIHYIFNHANM